MGFCRAKNCLTLFLAVLPVFCEGLSPPGCLGADGHYYTPGDLMPPNDPCELDCICKDIFGQTECNVNDCAKPTCENPISVGNHCCPVCGCDQDGVIYTTGDDMPSDNPCETNCFCAEEGHRICAIIDCLHCEHPIYVPGKCCHQCGCVKNGQTYNIGDTIRSDIPCEVDCTCGDNGQIQCKMIACAQPNCENPIVPKGQCCPVCGCTVQGKLFEIGQIVNKDPCHPCTCQNNGKVTCQKIQCSKLTCLNYMVPNGECCPVCRCRLGNKYYLSGEIVQNVTCKPLLCQSNGSIKAEPVQCSNQQLQCIDPVIPKGKCCPECKKRTNRRN